MAQKGVKPFFYFCWGKGGNRMDLTMSTITLGSVIAIVGCVIGILNFFGGKKKANQDEEARLVRMETMLVKIDENTSDLKTKVDSHDKLLTKHESKINVLEERIKAKGGK